jgi:hypothetical protein
LLKKIKNKCDEILMGDQKLQDFLAWVNQKSIDVNLSYKGTFIRFYYYSLFCYYAVSRENTVDKKRFFELNKPVFNFLDSSFLCDMTRGIESCGALDIDLDFFLILVRALKLEQTIRMADVFDVSILIARDRDRSRSLAHKLDVSLVHDIFQGLNSLCSCSLIRVKSSLKIQHLKQHVADLLDDFDRFKKKWNQDELNWAFEFRSAMIEYRNIGHDWQLSESQKKLIRQYYDTSQLLIDCLKSECYADRKILNNIENTMFLPRNDERR